MLFRRRYHLSLSWWRTAASDLYEYYFLSFNFSWGRENATCVGSPQRDMHCGHTSWALLLPTEAPRAQDNSIICYPARGLRICPQRNANGQYKQKRSGGLYLFTFQYQSWRVWIHAVIWVSGRSSVMQYHCITFWDYLRSGRVSPRLTVSLFGSASLILRDFFFWSPHLFLLSSSVLRRREDERNSDEKSARISRSGMCGLPVNNWPVRFISAICFELLRCSV